MRHTIKLTTAAHLRRKKNCLKPKNVIVTVYGVIVIVYGAMVIVYDAIVIRY